MKKCGIITDVDEQFVYVWNNELGFKELKFPVNPENKLEPGNVVNYNQTRAIHEVQNMHDIMREPNHEFVILKSKNPKIKWKAQVRLTFAPEYTEQYQSVISKTEHMPYPVKAVAYAEDILCLENTLMMAPSYNTSEINYEVGLVYNGFITRVPKSYEIPVEEVGSLFIVLGKNFAVETDPTIANRVLQKCPWNSMQNGTNTIGAPIRSANTIFNDEFGEQSDNGSVEWDALQNETNAPAAVNPRMANANVQEQKYNNEPPIKPGMAATGNSNEPTFAPSKSAMPNAKRTFSNEFRSSTQIRRQDSPTIYDEEPLAVKSVPPDVQQINENIGLIVRTEEEYSVLWSPIHDLVRIQFGYNETDNPHNYPIYRVGEWAQYLCWEELSTIHQGLHCAHTAYYIQKLQNARAPKETLLIGKNIVAKLSLKNRRNHSRQFSLAKDDFFGNILCSAGDVLFGRQFNQNHSPVKVLAVYTAEYKYSKWVAFAYQNYENNSWEKVIGLPSFIIKREIVDFMNSRRIGAEMQPSTSQQRAPEEEPHLPISQPMMTDEEKQHYLGEKVQKSESKLDQQPLRFHQPLRSLFEEPIESQWKGPVPQTQQQNAEEEEDDGEEERSTPDSFYQNNIPRFRPPLSVTMVSGSAADDDFLMPSSNENINWNCPRPFSPPTTEELANGQWTFIVQNNGNQQEEPSSLEEEENHQNQPSQPEEDEEEENVPQQQPPMDPDVPLIDLDNFDDDFIFEYNANANAQNNNTNTFAVQQEEEEEGIVMVENGEEKTMEQQQNGIGQQNGMMGGQNGIGFGHFGTAGQQNGLGMGQQIGTMGPKNGTTMNGLPLSEEEEKLRKQREFDAFLEATVEKKKKEMKNLLEL